MKNGNLIFQTIIALAVVALFILHFTDGKSAPVKQVSTSGEAVASSSSLVYVQLDSLLNNYTFNNEVSERLAEKRNKLEQSLATREQNFQEEVQAYQQFAGGLNAVERRNEEKRLQQQGQALQMFQARAQQELAYEVDSVTRLVRGNIDDVIAELQGEMGFDYVLQYESALLYGDSLQNITLELVQRLNARNSESEISE